MPHACATRIVMPRIQWLQSASGFRQSPDRDAGCLVKRQMRRSDQRPSMVASARYHQRTPEFFSLKFKLSRKIIHDRPTRGAASEQYHQRTLNRCTQLELLKKNHPRQTHDKPVLTVHHTKLIVHSVDFAAENEHNDSNQRDEHWTLLGSLAGLRPLTPARKYRMIAIVAIDMGAHCARRPQLMR